MDATNSNMGCIQSQVSIEAATYVSVLLSANDYSDTNCGLMPSGGFSELLQAEKETIVEIEKKAPIKAFTKFWLIEMDKFM